MKKLRAISLFLIIAVLFALAGCGDKVKLKEYEVDGGITLTLPEDMEKQKMDVHYASYVNDGVLVVVDKYTVEQFESLAQTMDIETYNKLLERASGGKGQFQAMESGDLFMTYNNNVGATEYFYYCTTREGSDTFWCVTFACKAEEKDKYQPMFDSWNTKIKVK